MIPLQSMLVMIPIRPFHKSLPSLPQSRFSAKPISRSRAALRISLIPPARSLSNPTQSILSKASAMPLPREAQSNVVIALRSVAIAVLNPVERVVPSLPQSMPDTMPLRYCAKPAASPGQSNSVRTKKIVLIAVLKP